MQQMTIRLTAATQPSARKEPFMDDLPILEEIIRMKNAGEPGTLVTIVESAGSSPRKAGAKMLVRSGGGTLGTIGGGKVEAEVIGTAVRLAAGGSPQTVAYNLTEEYGHVCGGRLVLYLEPLLSRPHLIVFGAGHVGRAIAGAARSAGYRSTIVDPRIDAQVLPEADEVLCLSAEDALARLDPGEHCAVAVATSEHESDFAVVRCALQTPVAYIGMLGSRRKHAVLMKLLEEEGYAEAQRARIVSPMGLDIGAETPAEIAVSIVAQLIAYRRRNDTARAGDSARSRSVPAHGTLQAAASTPG